MAPIQPRQLILLLAGKVIHGEAITDEERTTLRDFKEAYPALRNPVHVRCEVHPQWGSIVLDGEVSDPGTNMFVLDGQWICRACGDGQRVKADEVQVLDADWSRKER